jgi:hypothetical protein
MMSEKPKEKKISIIKQQIQKQKSERKNKL